MEDIRAAGGDGGNQAGLVDGRHARRPGELPTDRLRNVIDDYNRKRLGVEVDCSPLAAVNSVG